MLTGLARKAGAAVRVGTDERARSSVAESRGREVQVGGSGLVAVSSGAFVSFDTEGIVFSWVGGILRRGAGFYLNYWKQSVEADGRFLLQLRMKTVAF